MQVREVLRAKGREVISIECTASVAEAIARLVQNNIGSLPVTDGDGRLVGIFSERDVLRGIHNCGDRFGHMTVCEVMTLDPVTCSPDDVVDDVMGKMSDRRIAKVPVLSNTVLVGVVSVGDVIKVMYERVNTENEHLLSYIHGATF